MAESSQHTSLSAASSLGDVTKETAPKFTHVQVLNEAAVSEQTSLFKQGESEKLCRSVHVSPSRAGTIETTIPEESVSETRRAMPVLESARLSLPEKKRAAEKVDNLLPNEKEAKMKQETPELRKSFQSVHTASKSAATIETVSTRETPITQRQAEITMEHLHAVHDVEPTRETFGIEQASSFLERKESQAIPSQIRPLEKRAIEVVDKVLGDEKDTPIKSQKPGKRNPLQSVHFSSSQAVTIGAVTPCETTTSLKGEKIVPEVAKLDVKGNEAVNIADQLLPAEMGSSMEQLGYNSEHLICVQQVESTSEAKSVGQVTNLPQQSKSKPSVKKFGSPVMSAQCSQQVASSSAATLKDVAPVSASKVTHAHAVEEASISEMTSNLNAEEPKKKKHSRSVHFSPSRVASAEQIVPLESATTVPRTELACESASTILPTKTALKVGDQLIPAVRDEEMSNEKRKSEQALTTLNIDLLNSAFGTEQVANVPSISQCQVPVLIEQVPVRVAESSKITPLSATSSFRVAPEEIAPKLVHVRPVGEASVSEIATRLQEQKPDCKRSSRSVHYSPTRAASVNRVTPSESATDTVVLNVAPETATKILSENTAIEVGDQLIPGVKEITMNVQEYEVQHALSIQPIEATNIASSTERTTFIPSLPTSEIPASIVRVPIKVAESTLLTSISAASPCSDVTLEKASNVAHVQPVNETAALEQTSRFQQGKLKSGKSRRSVHVSPSRAATVKSFVSEESVSERKCTMPLLAKAKLGIPEKSRAVDVVDNLLPKETEAKMKEGKTELKMSSQSIHTIPKLAATFETVSTHETPLTERTTEIAKEYLQTICEVQPTSETVATEQVPSFRERSMSQTSSSQIGRPFMITESRKATVFSEAASLPVAKQEAASELTHVQPLKEAKASEMITHFKQEKPEEKGLARSVHVSPSRAPTIRTAAATSETACNLNVEQPKKMKQSGSVHISAVGIASVNQATLLEFTSAAPVEELVRGKTSTTISEMSAIKVGDQLIPLVEVEEMKKGEAKPGQASTTFQIEPLNLVLGTEEVENIPSIVQSQVPVSTERVPLKVAESIETTSLSRTSSFRVEPKVIAPKLVHVLPVGEASVSEMTTHLHAQKPNCNRSSRSVHYSPTRAASVNKVIPSDSATDAEEQEVQHASSIQQIEPTNEARYTEQTARIPSVPTSKISPLFMTVPFKVAESSHLTSLSAASLLSDVTKGIAPNVTHVELVNEASISEQISEFKQGKLKSEKSCRSVHVSPSRAATVETTIQQESVSKTTRAMPVLESARLSLPEKKRAVEKVDNLLPNEKEVKMSKETPELEKIVSSPFTRLLNQQPQLKLFLLMKLQSPKGKLRFQWIIFMLFMTLNQRAKHLH